KAIEIRGDPAHPPTAGKLCTKVARYLDRTYSPDRVLHPMRRIGRKGEGRFARIGWDEALDEIAARFTAIAASSDGPEAIVPYSYCGTMGLVQSASMDRRFFHRLGASLLDRTICATAQKCHEHIALLPGTDAALAYGVMHVLIADSLLDRDYIDRYTLGFDALATRAAEWAPQRVAATCGIDAEQVIRLAHDYGTIRPSAIRLNYGMQRVHGGANAVRAVACLPALVGAWRDPAGGALLSSSGTYPIDAHALERPDLIRGTPRTINMSTIGDALVDARDPPIRAIYVYNSNPLAVAPESAKVVQGFAREDLFCVVHDIFQTDTADYADILLPATTQLEHTDIHSSYGHLYALVNNPAIAPLGEALPNAEVFRRLAARMGFDEPCFRDSDEEIARQAFRRSDARAQGLDWETLQRDGWQRLNVPIVYAPFAQGHFPTPSGKCEFYSDKLE